MSSQSRDLVVVMAIDASQQAEFALHYYFDHLHRAGNKLVLAHVIELPQTEHSSIACMSAAALSDLWKQEEVKAKQLDDKFTQIIKRRGGMLKFSWVRLCLGENPLQKSVSSIKVRTEGGLEPGAVICSIAEEERAAMVVIGTRGMGTLRRTILGSVSDYVVHHAPCPVVICRRPDSH